jgi:hypothetical protein
MRKELPLMDTNKEVRKQLIALLKGGNAHMDFDDAVAGFPMDKINTKVPHSSYLVWHVLFHMRATQWDILDFVKDPDHVSPDFPDGYWPKSDETATPAQWEKIVKDIRSDLKAFEDLVKDPKTDFFSPLPHAKDYTVFREVLLAADHNAFHISELVTLRRVLNLNPVKEY